MQKISIIIPAYNTANFIEKCIHSLLKQTYKNFEIILINDGSTDETENICLYLSSLDNRIAFYSQKNKGVSATRNFGIEKASGEYICFIDSDDWVTDTYLQDFIDNFKKNETKQLIVQDFDLVKIDGTTISNNQSYKGETINIPSDLEKFISNYKYTQGYLWNKIFKTDVITKNNIKFNELMSCNEDEIFYLNYIQHIDEVLFLNQSNYNYVERNNSLSRNKTSIYSTLGHIKGIQDFNTFLLKKKPSEFTRKYIARRINTIFNYALRNVIYENNYNQKDRVKYLEELFHVIKPNLKLIKADTLFKKIDYYLFKKKLFKLLDKIIYLKTNYN